VVDTARTLSEERGVSYTRLEAALERNASGLFGW
jgi:hypothetical protein